jgi:hypothetical protein
MMTNRDTIPAKNSQFTITFPGGHVAQAVCVAPEADPLWIAERFNLIASRPAIFISGGASYMTQEDQQRTTEIMDLIAQFAQEKDAVIITGGTESGVMQMIGDMRLRHHYQFPLIGIAPLGKIAYPGHANPAKEADLEDSHSHFVLVIGDEWGDESGMIVRLTHTIAGKVKPAVGILINGGKIARHEVYLATTKELRLPMLVLEGSGRFADELATAVRTGKTNQRILQAIMAGGDIQIVGTVEGPAKMREKLQMICDRF